MICGAYFTTRAYSNNWIVAARNGFEGVRWMRVGSIDEFRVFFYITLTINYDLERILPYLCHSWWRWVSRHHFPRSQNVPVHPPNMIFLRCILLLPPCRLLLRIHEVHHQTPISPPLGDYIAHQLYFSLVPKKRNSLSSSVRRNYPRLHDDVVHRIALPLLGGVNHVEETHPPVAEYLVDVEYVPRHREDAPPHYETFPSVRPVDGVRELPDFRIGIISPLGIALLLLIPPQVGPLQPHIEQPRERPRRRLIVALVPRHGLAPRSASGQEPRTVRHAEGHGPIGVQEDVGSRRFGVLELLELEVTSAHRALQAQGRVVGGTAAGGGGAAKSPLFGGGVAGRGLSRRRRRGGMRSRRRRRRRGDGDKGDAGGEERGRRDEGEHGRVG